MPGGDRSSLGVCEAQGASGRLFPGAGDLVDARRLHAERQAEPLEEERPVSGGRGEK
jgi:hypothetical protein